MTIIKFQISNSQSLVRNNTVQNCKDAAVKKVLAQTVSHSGNTKIHYFSSICSCILKNINFMALK